MAYEYIAISDHPDDVISLSVGHQAETHAHIHYKGLLIDGLNPSPSGVLPNTQSSKLSSEVINPECIDELDCSSPSGTVPTDTTSISTSTVGKDSSLPGIQHADNHYNKRKHSREAIRRRRKMYKLRKSQKVKIQELKKDLQKVETKGINPNKKQEQPFSYKEMTVTVTYNDSHKRKKNEMATRI